MCEGSAKSKSRRKVTSEPKEGRKTYGPGGKEMPSCCSEMMAKMMDSCGGQFPAGEMMAKMMDSCGSQFPAGEMMAKMMKGCCDERVQVKSEARKQETSSDKK